MSEMSFEQMLEESLKTIRNGEVVEGTVIDVKPDEIILNIGYKSDGIITRNEYTNDNNVDLTTVVSVGDTMEAKVLKVNDGEGQVLLTYKRLAAEKGSERLKEAFENGEVLTGTVSQVLDGGLSVVLDETRIFIPASLVSDTYERDLGKYKDQEIQFVLTEFNPRRRRIIGDRKQLLVAEKERKQKELLFLRSTIIICTVLFVYGKTGRSSILYHPTGSLFNPAITFCRIIHIIMNRIDIIPTSPSKQEILVCLL